jgi:hypothetical protein
MVITWHLRFKHLNLEDRNTGMLGGGGGGGQDAHLECRGGEEQGEGTVLPNV